MQRDVVHLVVVLLDRGLDQRLAPDRVGLAARRGSELVQLGVVDLAVVEVADAPGRAGAVDRRQRGLGVGHRTAPAQHVHRGVEPAELGEVDRARHRVDAHLQAQPRPHRGEGLADLLVVDVAVVRAIERDLETLRIARGRQQLLRRGQVERQSLLERRVVVAAQRRDHGRAGGRGLAAHQPGLDALLVDRLVQRLAHALVLERVPALDAAVEQFVAALVHADEDDAVLGPVDDLHARGVAQARRVGGRRVQHDIELARDQRGHARRVALDRRVDHVLHVALELAPPVRVAPVDGLHVGLARDQHERAGAVGVQGGVTLLAAVEVLRPGRAVLLAPGLAHDEDRVRMLQEDRVHLLQVELDRQLVDLLRLAHRAGVDLDVGTLLLRPPDREHHVVGAERRAVVEPDVRAQLHAPLQRAGLLPLGGEHRHNRELPVAPGQRLVDLAVERIRQRLVARVRVHGLQVALRGPAQGLRLRRGGHAERQQRSGQHRGSRSFHRCRSGHLEETEFRVAATRSKVQAAGSPPGA